MSIFGNRVPRVEDPKLLTVGGTYVADLRIPELDGAAYVTYVRSTIAHARLTSIDVSEARTAPGVLGVFTGADIDLADLPPGTPMFNAAMTRPYLARDKVRYVGEPVAAIVTERPEQGPDAAELVWPDYDPLPAVVDPHGRPVPTRWCCTRRPAPTRCVDLAFGRTDDFFDGCEVVVTQDVVNQRVAAVPLEVPRRRRPRGSTAGSCSGRARSTPTAPATRSAAAYGLDAGAGARDRPRRRRRVRRQDRRLPRGAAPRVAEPAGRPAGAVGRDPQREHGRPRPRARPAPDDRDRRPARRHRRGLPPHRAPGVRRLRRDGRDPPVPHPDDGAGHLRDPEGGVQQPGRSPPTPRPPSPTAAPAGPRPPRPSSGPWTSSPPRSAWTRPRCGA